MSRNFKVFFTTYFLINILLKSLGNFCKCSNDRNEYVDTNESAQCNGIPNVI